jgi:hypothetical protein
MSIAGFTSCLYQFSLLVFPKRLLAFQKPIRNILKDCSYQQNRFLEACQ